MMELFENLRLQPCAPQPLEVVTPLGTIELSAVVGELNLTCQNCDYFYALENGGFAARWELSCGVAEAILCRPDIVEYGQKVNVTDYSAILWRFEARELITQLSFSSNWRADYTWKTGGDDSTQYFDAQTWENGEHGVTIGTEDWVALFHAAEKNNGLPQRFAAKDKHDLTRIVEYLQKGIVVNLGEVFSDENFEICFGIAWLSNFGRDPADTSLAANYALEGIQRKAIALDSII